MTQPDGGIPDSAIASLSEFSQKTQEDWDDEIRGKTTVPYNKFLSGWVGVLAGITGAANSAVNAITQIGTLIWKVGGSVIDDVGDFINAALSNAATALSNSGLSLAGLDGLVQGFFTALTGQTGATSYVDPVEAMTYLADQVSGHTQAIEELKAANSGSENGGISGGDNFSTPYTGSLGPGWSLNSTNGITTYVDTSTGKAEWHNAGNANPTLTARRVAAADAQTLTEFQKITATITTPLGGTNSQVRVYGRMSPDGQHYVVAWVSNSTVYIGYTTSGYAGEVVLDSGPLSKATTIYNGSSLSLECGTAEGQNEYDVRINGVNAQSYTDSTNLITTSLNYGARGLAEAPKGWGLGWRPGLNLGSWFRPATMSGCTVADNIPSEVKGHGFRVYRESVTATPGLNVGQNLSQYFDEIDYITVGSAWSTSGYTVPKAGHWSFSFGAYNTSVDWTAALFTIQRNGALVSSIAATKSLNYAVGSTLIYCEVGDVIAPSLGARSGTVQVHGSSSGADTFFSGALVSS